MKSKTPDATSRPATWPAWVGAALAAACVAGAAHGGQAGASFSVGVTLLPAGSETCTMDRSGGSTQVSCAPTVIAGAGRSVDAPSTAAVVAHKPESGLRVAGELVELSEDNHYAWSESNFFALGEYSSRLVIAGALQYVEMTVSW